MDNGPGVRQLRRRMRRAQALTVLLGMPGFACMLLSVPGVAPRLEFMAPAGVGGRIVWLLTGGFLFVGACLLFTAATQWARRLLWIRENSVAVPMRLAFDEPDGRGGRRIRARLFPPGSSSRSGRVMRIWVMPRDLHRHRGREWPAVVRFDPETGKPAVVDFEHGTLWAMAGDP